MACNEVDCEASKTLLNEALSSGNKSAIKCFCYSGGGTNELVYIGANRLR